MLYAPALMSVLLTPLIKSNAIIITGGKEKKRRRVFTYITKETKFIKKIKHTDLDIEFKINNFIELNLKIKRQNRPNKYVDNGVYQCAPGVQKTRQF
jgi:hypothetical protein